MGLVHAGMTPLLFKSIHQHFQQIDYGIGKGVPGFPYFHILINKCFSYMGNPGENYTFTGSSMYLYTFS